MEFGDQIVGWIRRARGGVLGWAGGDAHFGVRTVVFGPKRVDGTDAFARRSRDDGEV